MPEDLFFDDFVSELKTGNNQTFKQYGRVFEQIDNNQLDSMEEKRQALEQLAWSITCVKQVDQEDPVVSKLALYTLAHRNYVLSLNQQVMSQNKVNWGLKKLSYLKEFQY